MHKMTFPTGSHELWSKHWKSPSFKKKSQDAFGLITTPGRAPSSKAATSTRSHHRRHHHSHDVWCHQRWINICIKIYVFIIFGVIEVYGVNLWSVYNSVSLVKILPEIGQIMKIISVKCMVSVSEAYMQRKVNEYITEHLHQTWARSTHDTRQ